VDGIAQPLDAGYAAGAHAAGDSPVHQQRVELDFALAGEKGATTGIEGFVVFEDRDSGLYRIDRGSAALQQRIAGKQRTANAEGVGIDGVVGNGPGAAMNEKDGLIGHANRSSYMGSSGGLSSCGNGCLDYLHIDCVDSLGIGIFHCVPDHKEGSHAMAG
jgi:hypothetical protein